MFSNKARFDSQTPPMKLHLSNSSFSLWFEMPYASKNRKRSKSRHHTEGRTDWQFESVTSHYKNNVSVISSFMWDIRGVSYLIYFKRFSTQANIISWRNTTSPSNFNNEVCKKCLKGVLKKIRTLLLSVGGPEGHSQVDRANLLCYGLNSVHSNNGTAYGGKYP